MRRIKDLAPKPSDAIQAMIDGIKKYGTREDFQIRMASYGGTRISETNTGERRKICIGCAATCTIQQLAKKDLTPETIDFRSTRSVGLDIDQDDLYDFEKMIDWIRRGGSIYYLLDYYDVPNKLQFEINLALVELQLPALYNENCLEDVDKYSKLVDLLKSHNL